jgi:hypothetical protein
MIRLALLFLLIASQSWAAVARDAETTSSCSSCSSLEFFHTTAAGSDRMISVDVAGYHFGGTTVTGITYNAAALTSVGSSTIEDMTVETWRRVAQSTGSNPVAITLSGNAHIVAAPRTFTGVDQTTPFGTVATDANGGSTDLTAAITPAFSAPTESVPESRPPAPIKLSVTTCVKPALMRTAWAASARLTQA